MAGIKETKEAMALGFALAGLLKGQLMDGFQVADVMKIVEAALTPEMLEKMKMAVAGISEVPAEVKDVDMFEGLELAKFAIMEVKKLVA